MKKLTIISLLSAAFLILQSCNSDDENMDPLAEWTLSAPTLVEPDNNASLFLNVNEFNEEFIFTWSPASSSEGYNVSYEFLLSLSTDVDFETPIYSESLSETMVTRTAQELDNYLEQAGVGFSETADLIWTVKAISLDKEKLAPTRTVAVTRFEEVEVEIDALYILDGGLTVATLVLDGSVFSSDGYVALQEGVVYSLNTRENGTGMQYGANIGVSAAPNSDNVFDGTALSPGGDFTVERDQMYDITVDVEGASVGWQYYNMKLFHWDEDGGGWDARNEYLMTYVHPYQFTVTGELESTFHSKFNSPWDVQFGADLPSELSGTMTNNGGSNFDNITQSGTYQANIEIATDYSTGTYEFIIQ